MSKLVRIDTFITHLSIDSNISEASKYVKNMNSKTHSLNFNIEISYNAINIFYSECYY